MTNPWTHRKAGTGCSVLDLRGALASQKLSVFNMYSSAGRWGYCIQLHKGLRLLPTDKQAVGVVTAAQGGRFS